MINKTYSNDNNGDRIDDALFNKSDVASALKKSASTPEQHAVADAQLKGLVDVELIFSSQVTQQQIDDFILKGGEIHYMYRAVSYGWNGRIPLGRLLNIHSLMGNNLVLIDEPKKANLHMRIATQTGRVRPVWANGFAGSSGYNGDSNISIAIIDTGVDDSHTDLTGRNVYWHDYTTDNEATPRDILQHGSHVAGIALGSGASLGIGTTLYYTDSGSLSGVPGGSFYPSVIDFPSVSTVWSSTATWLGGGSATLYHAYTPRGSATWYGINSASGNSGLTLNTTFIPSSSNAYSTALLSNGHMSTYSVASSMTNFSAVGDGFNTLSGVSPGSNWVGAKVFRNNGTGLMSWTGAAIDDMVLKRLTYNIKIMNLSLGVNGSPGLDPSTRQKINNAAMNGILPVISAGNDGPGNTAASEVDDPGRAASALTIGASNDINQLTEYTSHGFSNPGSTPGQEEDYKPDILAPGGSDYYSNIMSVDSNDADGENVSFADARSNDYYNIKGTSMASPFAAGSAALLVDALQSTGNLTGGSWNFNGNSDVFLVKMLLSATATETNANREAGSGFNPTLQRASNGPDSFPASKDRFEGYGMLNTDAAIEGGTLSFTIGGTGNEILGGSDTARRAWARKISMTSGQAFSFSLIVPGTGDFDLYLYSLTPGVYGRPVILSSSTNAGSGVNESINYTPAANGRAMIVVKKISGSGQFTLTSNLVIYSLDVNKTGAGSGIITSVPSGIDCGTDCSQGYLYGTVVTLTASPLTGSIFTGWSGDSDCADGTVTMDSNKACTANFNLQNYTLNINKTGTGAGTVTSSPLGIDCGLDCTQNYSYSLSVTLTALPDPDSVFAGWSGDLDCADGIVVMSDNKSCTAAFNLIQRQLTTFSSPPLGGNIVPDCSSGCWYDSGTFVTLTATANNGYYFINWTGCDAPSNNSCVMTMDMDKTLTANFDTCPAPIRIAGTTPSYFQTLQGAYDVAVDGDTIQTRTITVLNDITAGRNIAVTLAGGYNCDYSSVTGKTVFIGLMTILDGTIIIGDYIFGN